VLTIAPIVIALGNHAESESGAPAQWVCGEDNGFVAPSSKN
jgi:hypothetical protein